MNFLQAQADYISFLYGLAYVILGSVAFIQRFLGGSRIRWFWLAIFGLMHGLHEWADLVASGFPDSRDLWQVEVLLGLSSFLALFLFSRDNAGVRTAKAAFLLLPIFLFGAIGGLVLLDMQSLSTTASRGVAVVAAALASGVILRVRNQVSDRAQRSWLAFCGIVILAYGVGEGFLEHVRHDQAGASSLTSVEVALHALQGLLALSMMGAVWGFIHRERQLIGATVGASTGKVVGVWHYTAWLAGSLVAVLGVGWYVTEQLGRSASDSVLQRSRGATEILATHLRDEMARTDLMAALLAQSPFVMSGLKRLDPVSIADAEAAMRQHAAVLESSTAFLMQPNGRVIASTEQDGGSRRVGEHFGFLPFFQDSAAYGLVGKDLAVEPDRAQRGYFVSHPVTWIDGSPVGTAVVKKMLAQTDKEFKAFKDWFLVHPAGIAFLASREINSLRPLWPLNEATRQQLMRTGELGSGPFQGPLLAERPADRSIVSWDGRPALVNIAAVRSDGWSAVIVENLDAVGAMRLYGILGTMAIALFTLSFFVVLHREAAFEFRLAEDQVRLRALNEELERQATTDSLTGLYNRMKFNALLTAELDRSRRYGSGFSLVLFDVDHFKRINDTWGHQVGDAVLVNLTRLARDTMRSSDALARWGGEEFMAILPMTDRDGALYFAQRVREALAGFAFEPVSKVSCSFGITIYSTGDSFEDMVQRADEALYLAKENGRDRAEVRLAPAA